MKLLDDLRRLISHHNTIACSNDAHHNIIVTARDQGELRVVATCSRHHVGRRGLEAGSEKAAPYYE